MNSRLGWRWTLFRAAAKPLVVGALSLTLVLTVLSPQAVSAQQLPGPAQPGIPLVAPPVIPQPAVPPTVVPETEPLAPPPGAENIRFKLDNVKLQGVTVYTPDQLKPPGPNQDSSCRISTYRTTPTLWRSRSTIRCA